MAEKEIKPEMFEELIINFMVPKVIEEYIKTKDVSHVIAASDLIKGLEKLTDEQKIKFFREARDGTLSGELK